MHPTPNIYLTAVDISFCSFSGNLVIICATFGWKQDHRLPNSLQNNFNERLDLPKYETAISENSCPIAAEYVNDIVNDLLKINILVSEQGVCFWNFLFQIPTQTDYRLRSAVSTLFLLLSFCLQKTWTVLESCEGVQQQSAVVPPPWDRENEDCVKMKRREGKTRN